MNAKQINDHIHTINQGYNICVDMYIYIHNKNNEIEESPQLITPKHSSTSPPPHSDSNPSCPNK